jgi:hypothetical protein
MLFTAAILVDLASKHKSVALRRPPKPEIAYRGFTLKRKTDRGRICARGDEMCPAESGVEIVKGDVVR